MAKPALGTKRICTGCEAKFYDLGKDPIVCPTCETVYVIPKPAPPRGGRAYTPRSSYDPQAQSAIPMGTLKEADAPGVADEAEEKEDAARTPRSPGSRTPRKATRRTPAASRCWKSSTRNNAFRRKRGAVPGVRRLLRVFGRLAALRARDRRRDLWRSRANTSMTRAGRCAAPAIAAARWMARSASRPRAPSMRCGRRCAGRACRAMTPARSRGGVMDCRRLCRLRLQRFDRLRGRLHA